MLKTLLGEMRLSADRMRCEGQACPKLISVDADLVIGGSDTVGLGLMPLLLEGYGSNVDAALEVIKTGVENQVFASMVADQGFDEELPSILVTSTTSGTGLKLLLDNEIEISMASRRIIPGEARQLRDAGAGNMIDPAREHIVAVDSLVVVTHPSNPIQSLTVDQIAAIYAGAVTNWSSLGGPNLDIEVVHHLPSAGTRAVFTSRILGDRNSDRLRNGLIAATNTEAAQIVSDREGAIAYVGKAFPRDNNVVSIVNECGITTFPDEFSAKTEEYVLQRRLYMYSREDTLGSVGRDFLRFVTSSAADSVVQKAGYTNFGIKRREQLLDGPRARMLFEPTNNAFEASFMREMLGFMVDFDRLSTTFRFRTGSAQLDQRGVIDLGRLVSYMENLPAGSEILLVGFTDNVGQFESNLTLSRERAASVADQVRAAAGPRLSGISISSVGFGEIAPTGCNTSEAGRRINRRVEVWLKQPTGI